MENHSPIIRLLKMPSFPFFHFLIFDGTSAITVRKVGCQKKIYIYIYVWHKSLLYGVRQGKNEVLKRKSTKEVLRQTQVPMKNN